MPVRHVAGRRGWADQAAYRLGPPDVAADRDVEVFDTLRRAARIRVAGRDAGKRLQHIAFGAQELTPDAHVDAVVEIDRAPFVRPGARRFTGSPACVLRKPL